jgi:hypothetical protein
MKKLASALGFLAIVGSSLPGNAPAVTAQSCNYYTGTSVTGEKVNLDTCSISRTSDRSVNFVYSLDDKKFASQANCTARTWIKPPNKKEIYVPKSQAMKKMLDRVCNEQISSNSSTEEKTESTSEESSIAQTSECGYEDDLIKAKCLSASFVKDIATVNILVENKSQKDIFLAQTSWTWIVVTSDSGQSTKCDFQGVKGNVSSTTTDPSAFSRLKPRGRMTISAINCAGLNSETTKNVSFNIDLTMWEKEKNSQLTISLTGIPIKKIPTR